IAWDNELDGIPPSQVFAEDAVNEDPEQPGIQVTDWNPSSRWSAASQSSSAILRFDLLVTTSVDTCAIFRTNQGATVTFQWSTDNSTWNNFGSPLTVTNGGPFIVFQATPQAARYWRVLFTGGTFTYSASHVFIGTALQMIRPPDDGLVRPKFSRSSSVRNARAEDGGFIARVAVERTYGTGAIKQSQTPLAWADSNWQGLWSHAFEKPFYWSYDTVGNASDTAFCIADGEPPPLEQNRFHYSINLPVVMYYT
ncbi:MAG: discoidin domain-containing protein, partial [Pseudomonadota bacterium]